MTNPSVQNPHTAPLHAARSGVFFRHHIVFVSKTSSRPPRHAPCWTAHATRVQPSPTTHPAHSMHDAMLHPFPWSSPHALHGPSSNANSSMHETTPLFARESAASTVLQTPLLFAALARIEHFDLSHETRLSSHATHVRPSTRCPSTHLRRLLWTSTAWLSVVSHSLSMMTLSTHVRGVVLSTQRFVFELHASHSRSVVKNPSEHSKQVRGQSLCSL